MTYPGASGRDGHTDYCSIQYHAALIHLFKPLLSLEETSREDLEAIESLLLENAKKGLALIIQYRKMYSVLYQSPLQLFYLIHICDTIISHGRHDGTKNDTARFCIETLEDAKFAHPVAGPLQRMFADMLIECNIPLPTNLECLVPSPHFYQLEDLLNVCSRPSFRPPIAQLLPTLNATLVHDFLTELKAASDGHTHIEPAAIHKQPPMDINSLLNH